MATGVAVVTGAASGFGRAIASALAGRGMAVVVGDLDGDRAAVEAATISAEHGVDHLARGVDVTNDASVRALVAATAEHFGRVDVVVSNVGVQLFGAVDRLTDDEWRWVLDVNVVGSARVARGFLPLLRAAPRGRLAFTTSSSVLDPAARLAAYQASKFAVWGLAETLRLEVTGDGIDVSVIFPSGMATRHLQTSSAAQPAAIRREIGAPDDFEAMAASNPAMVTAVATPEAAAAAVVDGLLRGERYLVTHGDLVAAVAERADALATAADAAARRGA